MSERFQRVNAFFLLYAENSAEFIECEEMQKKKSAKDIQR